MFRHSRLRSAGSFRLALPALIALLAVGGYLVASAVIRSDRDAAASRRAQVESVRAQGALGRARAYVAGLGSVLAGEPAPGQQRFARLAGGTAISVGLVDVLWVQRVRAAERSRYERRLGAPITRVARSGRLEPAPPAASYLPATFTTRTRQELRPGVDVSGWPGLGAAIRQRASIFAVSASDPASLGVEPGFYVLEASSFGPGPDGRGFLVVFVPRGWLTSTLEVNPTRLAINLAGRRFEGGLHSAPAASVGFEALARRWRIDVGREPPSRLQSVLPWVALGWPIAVALLVLLVGRGIVLRRRAELELERIFNLSLDVLAIAGLDGYYKRVNPTFERTLGYSSQELMSRPFVDFVHPADRGPTEEEVDRLSQGHDVVGFQNRYICRDGSVRWLEWRTRPVPEKGLLYAAARDVTDRRRAEDRLRDAQRDVEASRDELRVLAEGQAALRRVATLVARAAPPEDLFAAVAEEVGQLAPASAAQIGRYDSDGTVTFVGAWSRHGQSLLPVGTRLALGGKNLSTLVGQTGRPARIESYADASGAIGSLASQMGIGSAVGTPIIVEGRLWGVIALAATVEQPLPSDMEARLADFTDLVATAIANADSRANLAASRARIVAATDDTRRQIERDLHDGAQQRLVSLALVLRAAQAAVPPELGEVDAELSRVADGLAGVLDELREIARGIHPAILAEGGLGPAVKTLARRSPIPVELDVRTNARLPQPVEVAAYYVVSETLTNAAKHAHASVVEVDVEAVDRVLRVSVRDDGTGGADPTRGSGLVGLKDRVEALGGAIFISSRIGGGTAVDVDLPLDR